jgi:hypothetical protein
VGFCIQGQKRGLLHLLAVLSKHESGRTKLNRCIHPRASLGYRRNKLAGDAETRVYTQRVRGCGTAFLFT